jgi:hypothetical protein
LKGKEKKTEINDRGNPLRWPRDTLYPQKLALTLPTSGGRSVGIFRSRTKATEFSLALVCMLWWVLCVVHWMCFCVSNLQFLVERWGRCGQVVEGVVYVWLTSFNGIPDFSYLLRRYMHISSIQWYMIVLAAWRRSLRCCRYMVICCT